MSRKEEAVPRRTEDASVPTSLGESLETGSVFTISDAAALLAKRQEEIRQRIPRKSRYGTPVNEKLRGLDLQLVRYRFTRDELNIVEKHVEAEATKWETESQRREAYARWSNAQSKPISHGSNDRDEDA